MPSIEQANALLNEAEVIADRALLRGLIFALLGGGSFDAVALEQAHANARNEIYRLGENSRTTVALECLSRTVDDLTPSDQSVMSASDAVREASKALERPPLIELAMNALLFDESDPLAAHRSRLADW